MKKLPTSHQLPTTNYQEGVTLLLSVLILSGIFIIVTTVSILAIQEIRASRASALSEPAIVAAETSGEQGVWLLKRSTFSTPCPSATATQIDGTTESSSSTLITKCVSYALATFDATPSSSASFILYDPADMNGNLCMNADEPAGDPTCDGGQLYTNLVFKMISGDYTATATVYTLDGSQFVGNSVNIPPDGSTVMITVPDPIPSVSDERLQVVIESPTGNVTVQATTQGGVIEGLPDYPTIDAAGCVSLTDITSCNDSNETFKRRVNITVPR